MSKSVLEFLLNEIEAFFNPIVLQLQGESIHDLLIELGFEWPLSATIKFNNFTDKFDALIESVSKFDKESDPIGYIDLFYQAINLALESKKIFTDFQVDGDLDTHETNLIKSASDESELIGKRLFSLMIYRYLELRSPVTLAFLRFFGIIQVSHIGPTTTQPSYDEIDVSWDKLKILIQDPASLLAEEYNWDATEGINSVRLLGAIQLITQALGLISVKKTLPWKVDQKLRTIFGARKNQKTLEHQLEVLLFQQYLDDVGIANLGLLVTCIPYPNRNSDKLSGLVVIPFANGDALVKAQITPELAVQIDGRFDANFALAIFPKRELIFLDHFFDSESIDMNLSVQATHKPATKLCLIGSTTSSRLEYAGMSIRAGLSGSLEAPDICIKSIVSGASILIQKTDGDEFLQRIMPFERLIVDIDFVAGWSSRHGFYFGCSSGLDLTIPLHFAIGPLNIDSVYLTFRITTAESLNIDAHAAASASIEFGPASISIKRFGVTCTFEFFCNSGNLGPADLSIGFLPPTGLGLNLMGQLSGGGFLDFDKANQRYSGILALESQSISITAIGLITTKLPDNSDGFSMLASIGTTFNPPIQLGFGFTLSAVGGLIAINRSLAIDVLRDGIHKGTLDSILFPDPAKVISNASQIISDMAAVFVPTEGRHIIGPMVSIGYGSPTFITAEIGIFMELPDPVRVVVIGNISMALPKPESPVVVANINIVGALDFQKKELNFRASIYNSKLLSFPLSGEAAFLLRWGNQPDMALAIGGFHPRFPVPAPQSVFGGLQRLSINISHGSMIQLGCTGYLAVTPNSLQLGAHVDVFVGINSLRVEGNVSFDALIIFSPFSFDIDFQGSMAVKVGSVSVAKLKVDMHLGGPTPWKIHGKAVISLVCVDIDVHFNKTWGSHKQSALEAVDPWPSLEQALLQTESWAGKLQPSFTMVESFADLQQKTNVDSDAPASPSQLSKPIVVHPAGSLEIRQNIVPLGLTIQRFRNAPIIGHNHFQIDGIEVEGEPLVIESIDEFYSRGQFQVLSESQKLSASAFEKFSGGVISHPSDQILANDTARSEEISYESKLMKPDLLIEKPIGGKRGKAKWVHARFSSRGNAASRSTINRKRQASATNRRKRMVTVKQDYYVVVAAESLTRLEIGSANMTQGQAEQALAAYLAEKPDHMGKLLIISELELDEVAA